jgi:hypothetical protein
MKFVLRVLFIAFVANCATTAHAHRPSDSYLSLWIEETRIHGRWDVALRDLHHALGLDGDEDGAITWGEVKARHGQIAAYALDRLTLRANGRTCAIHVDSQQIERHSDGRYSVLVLSGECPRPVGAVEVD